MLKSKKFKIKLLALLAILLMVLTNFAYAESEDVQIFTTEGFEDLPLISPAAIDTAEQNSDLFLIDDNIVINYPVDGNVFVIGKTVTIDSTISGNVFILAGETNISQNSNIDSTAFICSDEINISGTIRDLYSASTKLSIDKNGYITRDLHSGCGTFILEGTIGRTANIGVDNLSINTETASIGGDLNYESSNEYTIPDGIVAGSINFSKEEVVVITAKDIMLEQIRDLIRALIYALIIILILVFAAKNFTAKMENNLTKKLWPVVGFGALGLIVTPIACIILLCTIIGIWASIALLFAYIFLFSATLAVTSLAIGKLICTKLNKQTNGMTILFSMLVALAIYILCNIPVLGGLVSLAKTLLGFGLVTYTIIKYKEN